MTSRVLLEIGTGKSSLVVRYQKEEVKFYRSSLREISYEAWKGLGPKEISERAQRWIPKVESALAAFGVPLSSVESWQVAVTGKGRQEWREECVGALAQPPFKVVPVSLQDEARWDVESVFLATGGAETPGLVVFLGSGSQSLCGSGGITALEDGGASHIPTAEAMDKYKNIVMSHLTKEADAFQAGGLVLLSSGFHYGLALEKNSISLEKPLDFAAARELMNERFGELMQYFIDLTAPTSRPIGPLCLEDALKMLQLLGSSLRATEEGLIQTMLVDDNLKSVVACLYGIAILECLENCGFQPNIWITRVLNAVPLGYYSAILDPSRQSHPPVPVEAMSLQN